MYVDMLERFVYWLKKSPQNPIIALSLLVAALLFVGVIFLIIASTGPEPPPVIDPEEEEQAKSFEEMIAGKKLGSALLGGSTDKYHWTQNEFEVDVYIPLAPLEEATSTTDPSKKEENESSDATPAVSNPQPSIPIKSKEINCVFKTSTISLKIRGQNYLEGTFFADVVPSECNWQIDDGSGANMKSKQTNSKEEDGTTGNKDKEPEGIAAIPGRRLWITLLKKNPTERKDMWRCVIKGDKEIDLPPTMPPVHRMNASDPASIKAAVAQLKESKKNK